jgi:hypothetical protein
LEKKENMTDKHCCIRPWTVVPSSFPGRKNPHCSWILGCCMNSIKKFGHFHQKKDMTGV